MTAKHTHHEIIVAYLEGKTIQMLNHLNQWQDLEPYHKLSYLPSFHLSNEYRIKPIDLVRNLKLYYDDGVSAYNRVKIRVPEHWETANLQVVIDEQTGDIKQVTLLK